jgi:hypothetical protein
MTAGTTSTYTPTSESCKTAVANYLLDTQGDWVDGDSLREVGGTAATRRVRELRAEGWSIRHRRNPEATLHFQYRLTRVPNKKVRSQYRTAASA